MWGPGNANSEYDELIVFSVRHKETSMTTLTTSPLAPLLDRLFAQADEAAATTMAAVGDIPAEELARLRASKTDYIDLYSRLKDAPIPVSRETGVLLYMLARGAKARSIVEFGTSFGISTLHLAAALRDNGGGKLITTEFESSKVARACDNLAAGGLHDLVEIRQGDALQTLKTNCRRPSICCFSTAPRASIPRSSRWSKAGCVPAPSWWRTMRTRVRSSWRGCVRPGTAISRPRSGTMSKSRCG
jgi:hypothetical protein